MTRDDLIKQAYAQGVSAALQELGYDAQQAQTASTKLAEDQMIVKTALSGAEIQAVVDKAVKALRAGAGRVGGEVAGAGGALKSKVQQLGSEALGAGRAAAGRAGEMGTQAGRTVGATAEDLIAALRGQPFPGTSIAVPRTTRAARSALGAGLLGGAGLGAGGMALAD